MRRKLCTKRVAVLVLVLTVLLANLFAFSNVRFKTAHASESRYCGLGTFTRVTETQSYSRKEVSEYSIKGDLPNYTLQVGVTTCANVAGTILVGYYDRFNENLVPNYKTYTQIGSVIKYKKFGTEMSNVMNELYSLMGTDSSGYGTTFNGFQNGMKAYAQSHNAAYSAEDLNGLNFEKYKTSVEGNFPVAIFLSGFSLLNSISASGNTDTIVIDQNSGAHVVIGCGYKVDTYYNESNVIIAQRTYLKVASGKEGYDICYLCLDGKSNVDKAITVKLT